MRRRHGEIFLKFHHRNDQGFFLLLTFRKSFGLASICIGILTSPLLADLKRTGWQKELSEVQKRRNSISSGEIQVSQTAAGAKQGGAVATCGTFKIPWPKGRTPYEKRFKAPLDCPTIPFGEDKLHKRFS